MILYLSSVSKWTGRPQLNSLTHFNLSVFSPGRHRRPQERTGRGGWKSEVGREGGGGEGSSLTAAAGWRGEGVGETGGGVRG